MTVGCTIVARNYLPYAHVLADSWRRHHRGLPLYVLVIDAEDGDVTEADGLEVLAPSVLGLPDRELARMGAIYNAPELTTALKAHLLRHLLEDGADVVIFVDSDVDLHTELTVVVPLAEQRGIVLSPCLLQPLPIDGLSPSETDLGVTGLYSSGLIAVGPAGRPFLDWWADRVRRDCLFSDSGGMHADQRWLDFVPSCFDHAILRDPGVNVSHWNLHERRIGHQDGRYTVNGGPLRAFHFSGYDPRVPGVVSPASWQRPVRFDVAPGSALQHLCLDYGARLAQAGYAEARSTSYGYAASAAGTTLGTWQRRVYRELLIAAEALGEDVPDPFDAARSDEFERLIGRPGASPLLSDMAKARLADLSIAIAIAQARSGAPGRLLLATLKVIRRLPGYRRGWMPHPLPSDRIALEYETAA
jgi:hypothetical protein